MTDPQLRLQGRSDLRWALLFLAPNFLGFLIFVALPVAFSLIMAFTNWDLIERAPFRFVGLENFKNMLWGPEARDFWKFLSTTVYFMLGLPISIAGSLLLAVMLNDPVHFGKRRSRTLAAVGCVALTGVGVLLCGVSGRQTIGLVLAIVGGSSLVAVAFNRVGMRTLFYLPFFTTGVAQFILWKLMFRPDSGPINAALIPCLDGLSDSLRWLTNNALASLGFCGTARSMILDQTCLFEAPNWLSSMNNLLLLHPETGFPRDPETGQLPFSIFGLGARDAIVIMGVWATVGGNNMLLYLAGLSNVPPELYEASMIDGAGRWRTFWNVSWPQLAPTTFFIVIMSIIGGLQGGFEQARVMTDGGPADTTVTLGYYIFREGFEEFRLGYASAVAWMLFLMVFVATLVNWRFGSRRLNV